MFWNQNWFCKSLRENGCLIKDRMDRSHHSRFTLHRAHMPGASMKQMNLHFYSSWQQILHTPSFFPRGWGIHAWAEEEGYGKGNIWKAHSQVKHSVVLPEGYVHTWLKKKKKKFSHLQRSHFQENVYFETCRWPHTLLLYKDHHSRWWAQYYSMRDYK